jgi:hypothetical protein
MPAPCDTPPPDDVHPADRTSITAASSAAAHLADFISRSFRREGRAAARFAGTGGRAMTKRFGRAVYSMAFSDWSAVVRPDTIVRAHRKAPNVGARATDGAPARSSYD